MHPPVKSLERFLILMLAACDSRRAIEVTGTQVERNKVISGIIASNTPPPGALLDATFVQEVTIIMPPSSPTPDRIITLSVVADRRDAGNPESPPMTETPRNTGMKQTPVSGRDLRSSALATLALSALGGVSAASGPQAAGKHARDYSILYL